MNKKSIVVIILLSLMLVLGCSNAEEPATAEIPHIRVVFDGETCQVTGHETGPLHGVTLDFENQTNLEANLITLTLKENQPPEEIFQSFQPGTTEFPEGTYTWATYRSSPGGESFTYTTTRFYEGNYAILCVKTATKENYLGGWFSWK